MSSSAESCNDYLEEEMSEHQLTYVGSGNLPCLESECPSSELWTKEELVYHLLEKSHVTTHFGVQKRFKVEPLWFGRGTSRITFMMKSNNNIWVGVGSSNIVDGEDVCSFILYHIPNVDSKVGPKEFPPTRFIANLKLRGKEDKSWTGTSPSIYENQDEILAAKKCLVFNIDPEENCYLEVDIIEKPVGKASSSPELKWEPANSLPNIE
ncbi:unnamed protein product [Orchesella dallaii]|uniref:Uncharacterized protein n=1 Tax=Orchesella dallaii TaxID=48710 RepID=A0ABP1RI64_9HEXA